MASVLKEIQINYENSECFEVQEELNGDILEEFIRAYVIVDIEDNAVWN